MTDRYAVFGYPIAHSKSPQIHHAFRDQFRETISQDLTYEAIRAELNDFRGAVDRFRAAGGKGANVTVPFKEQAYAICDRLSVRAAAAGAVNTLTFDAGGVAGDNTDGVGLVNDLTRNLGLDLAGRRILLMGAGGAARGCVLPLLLQQPECLTIANRTPEKAVLLIDRAKEVLRKEDFDVANFGGLGHKKTILEAKGYEDLAGRKFDLVINATAASLAGDLPPLPAGLFANGAWAYDMMYGRDTPFLAFARGEGARCADGLGMLVEQAAEAFTLWRGVRPATAPVIEMLRAG